MKEGAITINLTPIPVFLAILFMVLKLTGTISWGWIWVFSPIWISFAAWAGISILFFGLIFFIALVGALVGTRR